MLRIRQKVAQLDQRMPVVGIIADSSLEISYAVFVCLVSETIRKEMQLQWPDVVLMSFSLKDFGRTLIRSSQYCEPENRPRWWLSGDQNNITDMILCDVLIYLSHGDMCPMAFLQFTRRKKRIPVGPF